MGTVLFAVSQTLSHHNATYKLARALQANGHRICYAETLPFLKKSIVAQGFDVVRVDPAGLPPPPPKPPPGAGLWRRVRSLIEDIAYGRRVDRFLLNGTLYDQLMAEITPDLILLDTDFACNCVLLHQYGVPMALLQTYPALDKAPYIPVFTTSLPYQRTPLGYVLAEWSWAVYFCQNALARFRDSFGFGGIDKRISSNRLLKKLATQTEFPLQTALDRNRALHAGFTNLPEFITSPREFDFPRLPKPNQHYVSPPVDLHRKESYLDPAWADVLASLTARRLADAPPVVYCSLGTLSQFQYQRCGDFYRAVIEAFTAHPHLTLVLATGPFADTYRQDQLPPNIHLLRAVPQLDLLPLTDLMITHGGMNSLTECLYFGVPVVVYPLSSAFDQRGNAARVVHHGLGVQGNIRRDRATQIGERVDEALHNPAYRRNTKAMQQRIRQSPDFDNSLLQLEKLIQGHVAQSSSLAVSQSVNP